jgi:hypothetical protein
MGFRSPSFRQIDLADILLLPEVAHVFPAPSEISPGMLVLSAQHSGGRLTREGIARTRSLENAPVGTVDSSIATERHRSVPVHPGGYDRSSAGAARLHPGP